jgi:hypothetical protein
MKWEGNVIGMGGIRNADEISVANPEEKKPLERSIRRRKDIQIRLQGTGWKNADWIVLLRIRASGKL